MLKNVEQLFKVAIYLRLSKDDGDFSLSENGKSESNSICNQRDLIMSFIEKQPDMQFFREYKDDGFSGTNFERPDFKRMIEDIRRGDINCIIVKDLSRFGRDYIECGKYLEKIFPMLGIRFISLNDAYDTGSANHTDNIIIPFKNLINDSYSRDISIKVRSNLDIKRRNGDFVSNYTVYGYIKDPKNKNHLLIDEYAAGVVQDIFKWKIEGLSPEHIAARLNDCGILSPMQYKKSKGINYKTGFKASAKSLWSQVAVRRILKNDIYIGVLSQGKRATPNYKTKILSYRDKSQWIITEGHHEAIISRTQFETVQQLLYEDTRAGENGGSVHSYCGRIFCAYCGAPMVRKTVTRGSTHYIYYVCSTNKANRNQCSKHSIREDCLDNAVLSTLQQHIKTILDLDTALNKIDALSWEASEISKIDANIEYQKAIIEKNNMLRLSIYEDLRNGILSKDEFLSLKAEFAERIDASNQIINKLNADKDTVQDRTDNRSSWIEQFKKYKNISEINRVIVVSLIEKIKIYENAEIEIVFRYKDQFASVSEFLKENENKIIGGLKNGTNFS